MVARPVAVALVAPAWPEVPAQPDPVLVLGVSRVRSVATVVPVAPEVSEAQRELRVA